MTKPRPDVTLRSVARSAAVTAVFTTILVAFGVALFSEYAPTDGEFWVLLAAGYVSGFLGLIPIIWLSERGFEKTGWGRLILALLFLVPLQLVYVAGQAEVSTDRFSQFLIVLITISTVGFMLLLTEFWRRWVPTAQRETPSALLIVADTVLMLIVLTMSFGALLAVLEGLGAVKTEPELGSRAIWDSEVFFAWQFWDSIPELEVPDTLGWKKPYETADAFGGSLILLYKLLVILPVLAAVTDLWRRERRA